MESTNWLALIAVAIPGVLALIGTAIGVVQSRKGRSADAASKLTGAALKIVDELQEQIVVLKIERGISARGIRVLIRQIRDCGMEPTWIPNGNHKEGTK